MNLSEAEQNIRIDLHANCARVAIMGTYINKLELAIQNAGSVSEIRSIQEELKSQLNTRINETFRFQKLERDSLVRKFSTAKVD